MRILILGAGQVGSTLAAQLVTENNDITVVDTSETRLRKLADRFDLRTVCGHAAYPNILRDAGAAQADLVIAVTASDEVNIVACEVCARMFDTAKRIARLRAIEYLEHPELFSPSAVAVDVAISPEGLIRDYLMKLIEHPGALQVLEFADGRAALVGLRAELNGPMTGHAISTLREHLPGIDTRIAAIFRNGRSIQPEGTTIIQRGDEIFFIAAKKDIQQVIREFRRDQRPAQRIIIAGGGNIGTRLAAALESRYQLTLIEQNENRARKLSEMLENTLILKGSGTEEELLQEAGIGDTDLFMALTNDDEANVLSSLLAKRLGSKRAMTLITNPAYADLLTDSSLDVTFSPQQVTVGHVLRHMRRTDAVAVYSLRRGAAEAIEAVVHGEQKSSHLIGTRLADLELPPGTTLGAIVRDDEVLMAHNHHKIMLDDHLILFVTDKSQIPAIEKLFQPKFSLLR